MQSFLIPFYLLYRLGGQIKNALFRIRLLDAKRASIPTVSIGNIAFGGSHKTPLAAHLVEFLISQGYRAALISRGYKGRWERSGGVLSDGRSLFGSWKDSGDEPFMLASEIEGLGVYIGKNRFISCQKAHESGFDIAVLDDAFQHRKLQKDVDLVTWNPDERIALRESPRSLKRADVLLVEKRLRVPAQEFILKKSIPAQLFSFTVTSRGLFKLNKREALPLEAVKNKRVLALAGIARPERFFSLLQNLGIIPLASLVFPDHSSYRKRAIGKILSQCDKLEADTILTTQKDAVKLEEVTELNQRNIFYLKIGLDIDEGFEQEILRLLQRASNKIG